MARSNDIHILCFPAHTTHLLLPLDVGVFKSFKSFFNKSCSDYVVEHPGRVITADLISSLVAKSYLRSFTPVNIMGGFKKSGVFPFNPGAIPDQKIAPSKALQIPSDEVTTNGTSEELTVFSPEKETLFKKRYEEKYDLKDPEYVCWLRINHPDSAPSVTSSCNLDSSKSDSSTISVSDSSKASDSSKISGSLSEVLIYPAPQKKKSSKRKPALNKNAVCITDVEVLEELKGKKTEKAEAEQVKAVKKLERERKREEREKKKREVAERKKKKQEEKRKKVRVGDDGNPGKRVLRSKGGGLHAELAAMQLDSSPSEASEAESDAICPKCGLVYSEGDGGTWVCCDSCSNWFDFKCTGLKNKRNIPDLYYCDDCDDCA